MMSISSQITLFLWLVVCEPQVLHEHLAAQRSHPRAVATCVTLLPSTAGNTTVFPPPSWGSGHPLPSPPAAPGASSPRPLPLFVASGLFTPPVSPSPFPERAEPRRAGPRGRAEATGGNPVPGFQPRLLRPGPAVTSGRCLGAGAAAGSRCLPRCCGRSRTAPLRTGSSCALPSPASSTRPRCGSPDSRGGWRGRRRVSGPGMRRPRRW